MTEQIAELKFPCEFTFKVMGKNTPEFEKHVYHIILNHFPKFKRTETSFQKRFSKEDNYIALTIRTHAESKAAVDATYQELSASPQVLMAL